MHPMLLCSWTHGGEELVKIPLRASFIVKFLARHYGQQDQTFYGNIQSGSMIAYVQNYNSSTFASSMFTFESVSSFTASITSAPPNNLPLPVVPK